LVNLNALSVAAQCVPTANRRRRVKYRASAYRRLVATPTSVNSAEALNQLQREEGWMIPCTAVPTAVINNNNNNNTCANNTNVVTTTKRTDRRKRRNKITLLSSELLILMANLFVFL
jgi:hypothetical protein